MCSYLGIQDASRKCRMASQTPGAWAGAVISTDGEGVFVTVSQEKWDKAREMVRAILEEMQLNQGWLDHKPLERKRGFLLYVTRTYPAMVPYLKGIHLTLDGWRKGRDLEGWKVSDRAAREACEAGEETGRDQDLNAPKKVLGKPRLWADLVALTRLFSAEVPPKRRIRSKNLIEVYYGFGDASQDGFGFNIQIGDRIVFRFGQWCDKVSEKSSNYRELLNLVERLEEMVSNGTLTDCEVFLFTDNSTAESVYYKGNSSSQPLFELALRLRELEMKGNLILHMVHVAGTRMQFEGADGSSRGDQNTGVMRGNPVLKYVPLHLSAPEVQWGLVDWLRSCWDVKQGPLHHLSPEGWFTTAMNQGNYLWTPAPAAADVAGEQMARAVHKHPYSFHMFVVPRLMTARWRRRVKKMADFKISLEPGFEEWAKGRHEPLLIFVCLPLCSHRPWKLRGCKFVAQAAGKLRKVSGSGSGRFRNILRQLLIKARSCTACQKAWCGECYSVPVSSPFPIRAPVDDEGYDQTVEGDEERFKSGRNGDSLMCPFQCDLCHYRNIQGQDPIPGLGKDKLLLQCIRRASIDAFWSQESSTVAANARGARPLQEIGDSMGVLAVCPPMGPFTLEDTAGMALAVCILLRSLDVERTEDTIQFSTARYLRSVDSNVYHASAEHQTEWPSWPKERPKSM